MNQCQTPCIYYREIHEINKKPSVRMICDYKNGEEIKFSNDEINNCKNYKCFKDVPVKLSI